LPEPDGPRNSTARHWPLVRTATEVA